ncbi:uncharacterized protein LOC100202963 isoform X1 [Hydra vulgaris]|uniref:uncharacterized protein LOC100202963 isoform X1 n=2 Tax=Hydra vulgaris TaxID=6087 RepID=UPI001F5F66CB|nr:probable Xaa-Pro aminopeptidase P isoform X1 [Hydra vulgaris]XP_047139496.1 probable Xaa-Pro aminopeptidase P isoform X1 [Hydra vulgaris]
MMFALKIWLAFLGVFYEFCSCERICENGQPLGPYPRTVKNTTQLLIDLRKLMSDNGIHGYIVPSSDDHQTEYVAPWFERREFISGFSGSAGTAVITLDKSSIWVDGRYFTQVEMQVDCNWEIMKTGFSYLTMSDWIKKELAGKYISADPKIISIKQHESYIKSFDNLVKWKTINKNLVDEVWKNRPSPTNESIFIHNITYAGKSYQNKLTDLRQELDANKVKAIVITALDDVAWLFNLRGKDIPYNPMFYSYAVVTQKNATLFVANQKLSSNIKNNLCTNASHCVTIADYDYAEICKYINELARENNDSIWITPDTSMFIASNIPGELQFVKDSPIQLPKAKKNAVELEGMRSANIKDGIAIMEYFVWLEKQVSKGEDVTEMSGADQLRYFKSKQDKYYDLSFATTSAYGPHGAIIHYKSEVETNIPIKSDSLYLLDSGAHFYDGSTDITRTIHLGTPTEKHKEMFTHVLKGAIGLASAVFPKTTYGTNIEVYARDSLWKQGLDYTHGTGHGIGSFLSIHEGPSSISGGKTRDGEVPFSEGMVFSDEPGYYQPGEFGIRLETAIVVKEKKLKYGSFLGFDVLTWIPFDRKLINTEMLNKNELAWLNVYYSDIRRIMGPRLKEQNKNEVYDYMIKQTEPFISSTSSACSDSACFSSLLFHLLIILIMFTVYDKYM